VSELLLHSSQLSLGAEREGAIGKNVGENKFDKGRTDYNPP
jgi:hypothetical protein